MVSFTKKCIQKNENYFRRKFGNNQVFFFDSDITLIIEDILCIFLLTVIKN